MKKTAFLINFLVLCVFMTTYAQIAGQALAEEEERESFTERVEEGVRPKTPGRLTLYGELYVRGWLGGHNGNRYVQGADMRGSDSYFGILWEFTNFTGTVFKLKAFPEENGMNAYFDDAYVYSDIAGEAGSKNLVARISVGRFGFDSAFLSPVDPMNTGDDMQHDGNLDTLNWKFELGTKGDLYPILFMIASDLDFGYRGQGASGMTKFNNRGASGMFEVRSEGFNIADVVNMSWNVYYMGRFFPDVNGTGEKHPGDVLNKTQQTVGGTAGVTITVAEGQSVQVGAGVEYNHWFYGGKAGNTNGVQIWRPVQSLDWQAGVGYTLANQFAVAVAMRQNGYSHAQYAVMQGKPALTDMHVGTSFRYLGLVEMAKISLYAGFAYGFGSAYSGDLYNKSWNSGEKMYGSHDVDGYVAGNPISVDVGIGYHPVSNATISFGYNYGTWGVEAPDYAFRDVAGSWGKVYLTGAYTW